ncbi:phosphoribosylanthranilate isomerase [Raineyella antarctica]|uniref:N-(5'-phosphoribosyl)anthranilate isomerase n=1 Tax=Raineyella antarctica TaxID=1577474 RepID=A0A1G6HHH0_9ACTN|nr:phosphoribosylanthranilate isomerase [Raineyella antarctica]SDB93558.1 phosphoribosylanthranilate isomerase [Raineyella antarctica]
MTWAKICGICHPEDVATCVGAGVDALGFVVEYPADVPWNLTVARARELMALVPPGVERVAVVGDDHGRVLSIAGELRPDLVQLHADEDPRTTARLVGELHGLGIRVVKALRFDVDSGRLLTAHPVPGTPLATARWYAEAGVDILLVDSVSRDRPAGTGRTVDLRVARAVREGAGVPVVLAGGLRADNVEAAIEAVQPYGVDVISGVEGPVGHKDPDRVRAFLAAVRG